MHWWTDVQGSIIHQKQTTLTKIIAFSPWKVFLFSKNDIKQIILIIVDQLTLTGDVQKRCLDHRKAKKCPLIDSSKHPLDVYIPSSAKEENASETQSERRNIFDNFFPFIMIFCIYFLFVQGGKAPSPPSNENTKLNFEIHLAITNEPLEVGETEDLKNRSFMKHFSICHRFVINYFLSIAILNIDPIFYNFFHLSSSHITMFSTIISPSPQMHRSR